MKTQIPVTVYEKLEGGLIHLDTEGKKLADVIDRHGNTLTYAKIKVGDEEKIGRIEDGYLVYTIGT